MNTKKSKLNEHKDLLLKWQSGGMSCRKMAIQLVKEKEVSASHVAIGQFLRSLSSVNTAPVNPSPSVNTAPVNPSPSVNTAPVNPSPSVNTAPAVVLGPLPPHYERVNVAYPFPVADKSDAAVAHAKRRSEQLTREIALPPGHSIWPCPTQFEINCKWEARDWYQVGYPGGGENSKTESELRNKYPKHA